MLLQTASTNTHFHLSLKSKVLSRYISPSPYSIMLPLPIPPRPHNILLIKLHAINLMCTHCTYHACLLFHLIKMDRMSSKMQHNQLRTVRFTKVINTRYTFSNQILNYINTFVHFFFLLLKEETTHTTRSKCDITLCI